MQGATLGDRVTKMILVKSQIVEYAPSDRQREGLLRNAKKEVLLCLLEGTEVA